MNNVRQNGPANSALNSAVSSEVHTLLRRDMFTPEIVINNLQPDMEPLLKSMQPELKAPGLTPGSTDPVLPINEQVTSDTGLGESGVEYKDRSPSMPTSEEEEKEPRNHLYGFQEVEVEEYFELEVEEASKSPEGKKPKILLRFDFSGKSQSQQSPATSQQPEPPMGYAKSPE
jgi:hypothetical protein